MPPVDIHHGRQGYSRGFSLTELMVAMTLALLIIAAGLRIYVDARQAAASSENAAALAERLEFALALLEEDLLMAGYWGLTADPARIVAPGALSIRCAGNDVSAWTLRIQQAVSAGAGTDIPCPAFSTVAPDTPMLVVRHASAAPAPPRSGTVQLQTTHRDGRLFSDGSVVADGVERIHNVQAHAWYIDAASSEQGLPALRRQALVHGGLIQNQEIMPAIENMQILLGVDQDADGYIDSFISPGDNTGFTVMAVNITLTARSTLREPGFADADGFRRLQASRTIALRNRQPA